MKKKFISILSLIAISIFAFNIKFTAVKTVNAENGLNVKGKSAIIMDYNSGSIIYAKNENARLPIASMTKLMALLLTFENVDNNNLSLDEKITVSKTASGMGGSQVFLEAGGEYLCSDLVKSVIVASANDATVALCERLYGSEENAVEEMNKRAKELNLNDTLYSNSTGLTKPTQYSSAKDVANLLKELCTHKQYFNYSKIWMDEIKHPSGNVTEISNTNKLVRFYEGCDGGKTGFTGEAGFCLSATAKRGAMRLISVVIGGENSKERFNGVSSMFNYAFSNYSEKCVFERGEEIEKNVKVKGGKQENVKLIAKENCYIFGKKNEKTDFELNYELCKEIKAPVKQGQILGKVTVFVNNVKYDEVEVVAGENISKKTYFDNVKEIANNWTK